MELEEGYTYRFIPHFEAVCTGGGWSVMVHFYSELPPSRVYSLTGNSTIPAVSLQNFDGSEDPYKIVNNKKENILDITVKIDDNSWTGYNYSDIVAYIQNTNLREVVDGITPSQLVYFNKNSTEVTFSVYTTEMFNSEQQISVYGIKDGICSAAKPVNIPQLTITDTQYDNAFSSIFNHSSEGTSFKIYQGTDYNHNNPSFQFFVIDNQTGIDKEKSFVIEGKDVFEQYGNNISDEIIAELREQRQIYTAVAVDSDDYSAKFELPVWLGIAGYSYYIYDNGGNLVCNSRNTSNARQRIKELSKPDLYSISFKWESFGQAFGYFGELYVSKWDGTGWKDYKTIGASTFTVPGDFKNPTILTVGTHYPSNSFIKLYYYHISDSENSSRLWYTHPVYIYTGASNTPNRTVIYPPVDDYVLISSDAPVLARTIVTDQPYEVCKNWTKLEWEEGRKCIREDVLTFAEDDYTAKSFKMYDSEADLKNVKCYVVIVHFADGSVARSQIIQK